MKHFENGIPEYLTKNIILDGAAGIPMLMDLDNVQIPKDLLPFSKADKTDNKRVFLHCYEYDHTFIALLRNPNHFIKLIKQFDGFITPDCSLLIGDSQAVQQFNTYMNRLIGVYVQKNGQAVSPNIRWSDESSFDYCFLGVPKNYVVSISTHGCIKTKKEQINFKIGLDAMLHTLQPRDVIVHGHMPDIIFKEYVEHVQFHRYKSMFERTHERS